jgi:hypothetical protein
LENNNNNSKEAILPVAEKRSFFSQLSEDGWAVLIGGLLIAVVLAVALSSTGLKFTTPVYQWADADDLFTKVLIGSNLLLIAGIGLVFAFLSSLAIWLSGGNIKKYITGFGLIYVLAIISLVIAGSKTVSYYGIEYVVFALIIGLLISNLTVLPAWIKEAARSEFLLKQD